MAVQPGLCQTWSETQIVGLLEENQRDGWGGVNVETESSYDNRPQAGYEATTWSL